MSRWMLGLMGAGLLSACGEVEPYESNSDGEGTEGFGGGCPERRLDEPVELVGRDARLEVLDGVTHVESLVLAQTTADSLDALSCLEVVEGELAVRANENLTALRGLENLQRVGHLRISENPMLTDLVGLPLLATFNQMTIVGNGSLAALIGLPTGPVEGVEIRDNPSLADVCDLANLVGVKALSLESLPALDGLGCLQGARDWWSEAGASATDRSLEIRDNPALVSLSGVPRANAVLDIVAIEANETLLDLYGLHFIEAVGDLTIRDNPLLASLSHVDRERLGTLDCVESLTVLGNQSLADCEIGRLVSSLTEACGDVQVDQMGNLPDECS